MELMREQIAAMKQQLQVQTMQLDRLALKNAELEGSYRTLRRAMDAEKQQLYASLDTLTRAHRDQEQKNDHFVFSVEKALDSFRSENIERRIEQMQASLDGLAKAYNSLRVTEMQTNLDSLTTAQEHNKLQNEKIEQRVSEIQTCLNNLAQTQERNSLQSEKTELRVSEMQASLDGLAKAQEHNSLEQRIQETQASLDGLLQAQERNRLTELRVAEMQASLGGLPTAQEHNSLEQRIQETQEKTELRLSEMQAHVHALAQDHKSMRSEKMAQDKRNDGIAARIEKVLSGLVAKQDRTSADLRQQLQKDAEKLSQRIGVVETTVCQSFETLSQAISGEAAKAARPEAAQSKKASPAAAAAARACTDEAEDAKRRRV